MDSNLVPTMLVCTRFGLGVRNRAWFAHRLRLIEAITAASLSNQTRRDFVWAIFVDPELDPGVRAELERIVSVVSHPVINNRGEGGLSRSILDLAEELDLPQDGYMLTARIDDDDAWSRNTVERVYAITRDWLEQPTKARRPGTAITFAHGLEWLMYDMVDIDKRAQGKNKVHPQGIRPYTYHFHSMSVFVLADLGARITAMSGSHSKIVETFREYGMDLLEQTDEDDMWLYSRHKQTNTSTKKAKGEARITDTKELQERFGLNAVLVDQYITDAGMYGYVIEKRPFRRRKILRHVIHELEIRLTDPSLSPKELRRLTQERNEHLGELARISTHNVGEI